GPLAEPAEPVAFAKPVLVRRAAGRIADGDVHRGDRLLLLHPRADGGVVDRDLAEVDAVLGGGGTESGERLVVVLRLHRDSGLLRPARSRISYASLRAAMSTVSSPSSVANATSWRPDRRSAGVGFSARPSHAARRSSARSRARSSAVIAK